MAATSEKVAVVTGAGAGIGQAVALTLAAEGYRVALAGRRSGPLEDTAGRVTDSDRVLIVPTDVRLDDSVDELFDATVKAFERVDLLFNNAGIPGSPVPLEDLSTEDWQAVVDTNLTGAFLCTRAAFNVMKNQRPRGGRIINNGSISAHTPRPNSIAYTATKHAMTGLTKSTALDGRKYDIACGQVDIGNAATALTERMASGVPQPDGTIAPEPRMDTEDVARGVLYMANLPLDSNVLFMTVMATKMPYVGRG